MGRERKRERAPPGRGDFMTTWALERLWLLWPSLALPQPAHVLHIL